MKNSILTLIVLAISFMSFSQNDWTLYKNISGVNIYTKDADCYPKDGMPQTAVLFKFENTTSKDITIEWDTRVWYNGEENTKNVDDNERHYTLNLVANQTKEGDIDLSNNKLYLYKKFLNFENASKLTRFELENIKVTITK